MSAQSSLRQRYCGYCQRYRSGEFRLTGNKGLTPICAICYELRRRQTLRKPGASVPRARAD